MGFLRLPLFLVPLLVFSMLQRPISAMKQSYVVYMGSHPKNSPSFPVVADTHYEFLASFLGSIQKAEDAIFHTYTREINGFAAILEEKDAKKIAKSPNVVSVFPDKARQLHTTHSWEFLGLENKYGTVEPGSLWDRANYGADTIIANLDTGVWPESKSFNDVGYGPIPARWKGTCEDNSDDGFTCNRKLIGARYFNKGYEINNNITPNSTYNTPRDYDGHGTHTLSTAGGDFVANASVFGYGNGTAKGGSPKARVAAYKVCYSSCYDSDIMAGFDAAISDGVDVISVSLGGDPIPYFLDSIAIGSFHAIKKGIVVVSSAGNSGPTEGTVSNVAPWLFTIAASTTDRDFPAYVDLGNGKQLTGQSLSESSLPVGNMYPLLNAADAALSNATTADAQLCEPGTLNSTLVSGTILVCLRGVTARVDKGEQALLAGAVGMILANDVTTGNELIADAHVLPASHITYDDGLTVYAYLNSTASPMAYITKPFTEMYIKPAPFMSSFSSVGPNTVTPDILKPDITAPGVSVIAAWSNATSPTGEEYDTRRVAYNSESGTSMSCPHVSGVSGLLKTVYPNWTPGAIKSAIMTTATTMDNEKEQILNSTYQTANPFNYGSGHLHPNNSMDPGLVYNLSTIDYLNFLCAIGYSKPQISLFYGSSYTCPASANLMDFNYPTFTVNNLTGIATLTRILTNVGSPATYKALVTAPSGISVSVNPATLTFHSFGEEKTFKLTLQAQGVGVSTDYVFGRLIWTDGFHNVTSPIVVKTASVG